MPLCFINSRLGISFQPFLDYSNNLIHIVTMMSVVPILIEDQLRAGRPPFNVLCVEWALHDPMMPIVLDLELEPDRVQEFFESVCIAEIGSQAAGMSALGIFAGQEWHLLTWTDFVLIFVAFSHFEHTIQTTSQIASAVSTILMVKQSAALSQIIPPPESLSAALLGIHHG
jgi:hypothetical protein